ncbi:MAG: beta-ketoacyl synthase chain length factor [Maribacter sp.]|uniref:beta-ketoacyl synthase N-terminal-like domain-containing protein n=1 Tax=Maribacter sp. 2307UL18-2 TaxID=3386274 RepID=UPI0039BCA52A
MKKSVYINSVGSVSAQKTFDNSEFLEEITDYEATELKVVSPNYKAYIPPAAARRMAKGIKMSTVSSQTALKEAGLENIDAIIVGTGLGCLDDSSKFVSDIIKNEEQFLTPTRFIQSSHNTVAGQIALGLGCKGYNFTYVNSAVSFESSLLDAQLQLENDEATHILVGGVDEMVEHHVRTHQLIDHFKNQPVTMKTLLSSKTEGAVMSEGSHFFVLSNEKQDSTYAELLGLEIYNELAQEQLPDQVRSFLKYHDHSIEDIDLVVLGNNGDINFDGYYQVLSAGLFANTPQAYFKHLSGEFDTASAFAFWLSSKIIKTASVPDIVKLNALHSSAKTVLIYNQYRGKNHSLVLLKKC